MLKKYNVLTTFSPSLIHPRIHFPKIPLVEEISTISLLSPCFRRFHDDASHLSKLELSSLTRRTGNQGRRLAAGDIELDIKLTLPQNPEFQPAYTSIKR